jgi:hypothetical protein
MKPASRLFILSDSTCRVPPSLDGNIGEERSTLSIAIVTLSTIAVTFLVDSFLLLPQLQRVLVAKPRGSPTAPKVDTQLLRLSPHILDLIGDMTAFLQPSGYDVEFRRDTTTTCFMASLLGPRLT